MTTSDTQYKLAGNLQFENVAMNNAETAIAEAENWLATGTNSQHAGLISDACNSRSVGYLYPLNNTVAPPAPCLASYTVPGNDPLTMIWDNSNSIQAVASDQRYIIELLSTNNILVGSSVASGGRSSSGCKQVNTYRITSRGVSARGASKFVQSYYSVLSCLT